MKFKGSVGNAFSAVLWEPNFTPTVAGIPIFRLLLPFLIKACVAFLCQFQPNQKKSDRVVK